MKKLQKSLQTKGNNHVKVLAYAGLIFVVLVWGSVPLFTSKLITKTGPYSASMYNGAIGLIAAIALLCICAPKLKELHKGYFLLAVPTGFFNAIASLLQKIGLKYTTPAQYAFLENLSCVLVPILLFFFIKKKPSFATITACLLCLVGSFVLSGMDFSGMSISFGIGEILCALAGLCYGVNIAATGAFAKKMNAGLYVMIQMWVQTSVSFLIAVCLHNIHVDGAPIERAMFSWQWQHVLGILALALGSTTLCWLIRTSVMKYIDTSAVAVIMPCSAVVAGVLSVIFGADDLTLNLALGATISFAAAVLSGLADVLESKKKAKTATAEVPKGE
ncbi:MAG: DMT family transporter [Clostridia bacterium]|nr:DMT family transporter [Clostridia bacterium]